MPEKEPTPQEEIGKEFREVIDDARSIDTWDEEKKKRVIKKLCQKFAEIYNCGFVDGVEYAAKRN